MAELDEPREDAQLRRVFRWVFDVFVTHTCRPAFLSSRHDSGALFLRPEISYQRLPNSNSIGLALLVNFVSACLSKAVEKETLCDRDAQKNL